MTALYYYIGRSLSSVVPVNLPPVVVSPIPNLLLREGDPAVTFDLAEVFIDPNGDGLTFSIDGTPPDWATLSGSTLSIEPGEGDAGSYAISVRATDDGEGTLSTTEVFAVGVLAAASGSIPTSLRPVSRWPEKVWPVRTWPASGPHRKTGGS